ncbi:uncharacterized protein LOC114165154 [Vigna unguiculata]|uniref:uncharacterized protein LOC114165154 n=1 Tax=Vigna unguiculata TaxID=3917 RepID=UPI001016F51D|nr:uncharacterized protein LOC114165154 [Vigna unguiculata]
MCPTENKLVFSIYMLTGEAEHWWISTKSILEKRDEPVTREAFRGRFLSEYFPDSIWYAKEVEFLQLTQGGKMVTEYAERFKHLGCFYTLPLDEEWRCRKFENGLRGDIRLMVAPLSIKNFAALVEKDRVMEKMKREGRVQCYICGGPHLRSACPRKEGYRRCNNYDKEGHFGKDCPNLARVVTRPPVQTPHQHQRRDRGNKLQVTSRVYAMTGAEATGSGNLVVGNCVIAGMSCYCELAVSTPASGLVRTSSLCARCPVEVEGRRNALSFQGDAPDIARAIEAMVATMAQQSTAMM